MRRTVLALTALAFASGAFAQSTSTTMDMGGGMTHVDTMGPNGAMSSSNCMNIGGGMASCQTMDMSQPQRTYPTPDMSRPQRTYERPEVSDPEPSYPAPYVSRLPMPAPALSLPAAVGRPAAATSSVLAAVKKDAAITPAPMSLVSRRPIPIPDWVNDRDRGKTSSGKSISVEKDSTGTEYTVNYLGHTFLIDGHSGMTIEDIRLKFETLWNDDPWIEYSSTVAGTVNYFSIKSEKIYGDRIEVWTKADHSKDRTEKARESKELYEIRCEGQTIRSLQFINYDASLKVISSRDYPQSASRAIPDTVGSALVDEMCKVVP